MSVAKLQLTYVGEGIHPALSDLFRQFENHWSDFEGENATMCIVASIFQA